MDQTFKYAILGSGLSTLIAAQSIREADTETPVHFLNFSTREIIKKINFEKDNNSRK